MSFDIVEMEPNRMPVPMDVTILFGLVLSAVSRMEIWPTAIQGTQPIWLLDGPIYMYEDWGAQKHNEHTLIARTPFKAALNSELAEWIYVFTEDRMAQHTTYSHIVAYTHKMLDNLWNLNMYGKQFRVSSC